MVEAVANTVRELRQKRDEFQEQLRFAKTPQKRRLSDQSKRIDAAMKRFSRLRETLQAADMPRLHGFLQSAVEKVVVDVEKQPNGKRSRYLLRGGEIHLSDNLFGIVQNPGCPGQSRSHDLRSNRRKHPQGARHRTGTRADTANYLENVPQGPLGRVGCDRLHDGRSLDQGWTGHVLLVVRHGTQDTSDSLRWLHNQSR